jgi:hypothetical protein
MWYRKLLAGMVMVAVLAISADASPRVVAAEPLWIAINNPIPWYNGCAWDAVAGGGTPPYVITWETNNIFGWEGTDPYDWYSIYYGTQQAQSFWLTATVTDHNGLTATATYADSDWYCY